MFDSINWISQPKISPDGKRVAFAAHETAFGDDRGGVAVIDQDGHEKLLSSGWASVEGVLWSPGGDEVWFSSSSSGSADNLRGVSLDGKLRSITNVPGGMWLQDLYQGSALMVTHQTRIGLRGVEPGGKQERELGWFGWSELNDMTPDGKQILFDEEGDGGGPNYTMFLRNTDGSPPVRIGEGVGFAVSADGNWVITQPAKGGPLSLVPTGAGEARVLTHDNVNYSAARFLADGKHLLAVGIETGRGVRDYLIELSDGASKPVTPEGTAGLQISPNGRSVILRTPDERHGVWPLDGGDIRPIPGLEPGYISGWTPDGLSVYVRLNGRQNPSPMFKASIATGKMEPWKTFGTNLPSGTTSVSAPLLSKDGSGYVYSYVQDLSQAYVIKGLK